MPKFSIAIDIGPEQVKVLKMAKIKGDVVLEAVEIMCITPEEVME